MTSHHPAAMHDSPSSSREIRTIHFRNGLLIGALVLLISILHFSTDITLHYFHEIYKVLYYIPIILAAIHFGVRGGLSVSLAITVIYTLYVVLNWTDHQIVLNRFVEMIVFNAVAFITGKLVESERKERQRYIVVAQELQGSYEKLRQQSEQLAEVEEKLRSAERLATVGELAASLAHEVRNPLGAIKGAAEILRDEYPDNGRNREFADMLIRDVDRMNLVIKNYLELVKPGKSQEREFDPIYAARTTVQMLQPKARKEGKSLRVAVTAPSRPVPGDETKFRQLLLNLFLNAFAAVDRGGEINFSLQLSNEASPDAAYEIMIGDNGPGIPEDILPKVFKPFFTTKPDGTGLGLAIAQRIAEEHNWKLSLESTPGQGVTARLSIRLPAGRE